METVESEIQQYITQLNEEEKQSVLQLLKTFIKGKQVSSERISIEQYNEELEASERQIDEGRFTTQEDLERELKQW